VVVVAQPAAQTKSSRHERMLTQPIHRVITAMAIPTVMNQMVTIIYNTVDTYFVSRLHNEAAAAVGVSLALVSLSNALTFGISMGAKGLISRRLGAGRLQDANTCASSALAACVAVGVFIMVLGLAFLEPLMVLLGAYDDVLPHACDYAKYLLWGTVPHYGGSVLACVLQAQGMTVWSTVAFVTGSVANVLLDPLFIFTFGMEAGGAALATSLSQMLTLVVMLVPFLLKKSTVRFRFAAVSRRFGTYFEIIHNGLPTVFRQGSSAISSSLLNHMAGPYGSAAVAAITVANKVYMMVRSLILGFGQGYQPVAGYNYGAKRNDRVRRAFGFVCIVGTSTCTVCAVVFALLPDTIIHIFRDDPEVVETGARMLMYLALSLPFLGYSTFVNQTYQVLGFSLWATVLACCRQGLFFAPAIFLLHGLFGLEGVLMTQAAADILTGLVSIPFHIVFLRRILRKEDGAVTAG